MKKLGMFTMGLLLTSALIFGQKETAEKKITDSSIVISSVGSETTIKIKDKTGKSTKTDTTHIKIGNKAITIMEDEEGTNIKVKDLDEKEADRKKEYLEEEEEEFDLDFDDEDFSFRKKKKDEFDGHWSGFEMGMNNYVNNDFSMQLSPENQFMELNTGKSWNVNINIIEYSLGLGSNHFGLVTGLGFEFNDYKFDGNNNIQENDNGVIVSKTDYAIASLVKSKINMLYLTLPLLFEFQLPPGADDNFYLSAGVIGGLKLRSHSKVVYKESGDKQKIKDHDDFNISPLRYGVTMRMGYKFIKLYANYYPVALFEKNEGPELYPFAIGLTLLSF